MIRSRALQSLVGALALSLAMTCASADGSDEAVMLDVTLKLTELDYKPLPNVPAWVVFGSDPAWQSLVPTQHGSPRVRGAR